MSAHTPGPWTYDEMDGALWVAQADNAKHTLEASDVGIIRIHTCDPGPTQHANARLIAAAPELLEALQMWIAGQVGDAHAAAKAAVAKATGA